MQSASIHHNLATSVSRMEMSALYKFLVTWTVDHVSAPPKCTDLKPFKTKTKTTYQLITVIQQDNLLIPSVSPAV
jgi:hypothetical protein